MSSLLHEHDTVYPIYPMFFMILVHDTIYPVSITSLEHRCGTVTVGLFATCT